MKTTLSKCVKNFLLKAKNGQMRIEIAVDQETAQNVGYCISQIEFSGDAEMKVHKGSEVLYTFWHGDSGLAGRSRQRHRYDTLAYSRGWWYCAPPPPTTTPNLKIKSRKKVYHE